MRLCQTEFPIPNSGHFQPDSPALFSASAAFILARSGAESQTRHLQDAFFRYGGSVK